MRELLPWLIGGWILLGGRKSAPSKSSTSTPAPSPPPLVAYLYQLPTDSYTTVRVALGHHPDDAIDKAPPVEVGIFQNEAEALALLVHPKGYALAWPGVKQLAAPP